jgi:hypothetical protein
VTPVDDGARPGDHEVPVDDDIWSDDAPAPGPARSADEPVPDPVGDGPARPSRTAPTATGDAFPTLDERARTWWRATAGRFADDPGKAVEAAVSMVAVALATGLVLATLRPEELWRDTTPTGGDMGSHVWGPRYLLDHLLPQFRLSGWTPDWYSGFPAYQFYMVVPSLLVVVLHVGLVWYLAVPATLATVGGVVQGWARERLYPYRFVLLGVGVLLVLLIVPVPYNRSFKLVTAIGLLALPAACWACAKLADLPFPIPPLAVGGGLLFLYNREPAFNGTGNIIGGNFHSTMAGEFAFSISLTVAVLYLGVAARGLRTGKHRSLAAALFALAGLCHLIPAFFVLACTAALFVIHPDRARLKWLATMVPVAGLLTAFWVLPFWWRSDYVNDMGWEKLPAPNSDQPGVWYYLVPQGMKWLLVVAAAGVVVSIVRRYALGLVLGVAWVGVMVAFTWLPQARLWNARLLPFLFLSVCLLAAIGLGEVVRLAGAVANGRPERPLRPVTVSVAVLALLGVFVYVSLPLVGLFVKGPVQVRAEPVTVGSGADRVTKERRSLWVGPVHLGLFSTTASNGVAAWSQWNYKGLELKEPTPAGCALAGSTTPCTSGGWPEYRDLMATMAKLGRTEGRGCGRAFWEYDNDRLSGYGTPMAPMMLPYWTDGCIGSQEGLYFESSATVPFHFLMQSELSAGPSQPQRELPYPAFDIDAGVRHLQLLGVKYYMASTATAVAAATAHPDLEEVAVSGPWHIYEVDDAPLVSPLAFEPVVARGMGEGQLDWLPTADAWFLDQEDLDVPLAVDGPKDWKRVGTERVPEEWRDLVRFARQELGKAGPMDPAPHEPRTALPANRVTAIHAGRDEISFDVSKVGVPVLVKTSYFPNWEVDGADGPYRVTPNLMVVVPTSTHVRLHYGRAPVDLFGAGMSLLGIVGLVVLARRRSLDLPEPGRNRVSEWIDSLVSLPPEQPAPVLPGPPPGPHQGLPGWGPGPPPPPPGAPPGWDPRHAPAPPGAPPPLPPPHDSPVDPSAWKPSAGGPPAPGPPPAIEPSADEVPAPEPGASEPTATDPDAGELPAPEPPATDPDAGDR